MGDLTREGPLPAALETIILSLTVKIEQIDNMRTAVGCFTGPRRDVESGKER